MRLALVKQLLLLSLTSLLVAQVASMATTDCAVVGVGVLGTFLCQQILEDSNEASVVGVTKTDFRHANIAAQIKSDRLSLTTIDKATDRYTNVVFCAPPSGSDDYPAAVKQAVDNLWAGPEGGGVFVFTSSGSV
jgi:hypothetical protein